MSYKATVYTHREDGASIVYVDNYSTGGYYVFTGSNSAGYKTEALEGDTIFTAIVPSGYKFKQWVYRLGNLEGSQQHNTSNPFTYRPAMDVYIWAEIEVDDSGGGGGSGTGQWTLTTGAAMTDISTTQEREITLEPLELYRVAIKPKNSGTLTAMTVGGDTYGYLTETTSWSAATGKPTNVLVENDDNPDEKKDFDFKLTYEVEAGKTYYLWVSLEEGYDYADVFTIVVIPPGGSATVECTAYVYDNGKWVQCTPYIYDNGWKEVTAHIFTDA